MTPLVHMQLATLRSAAEIWEFIDAETERRKQQAESAAVEQKGVKALPPSKRSWAARPWQCLVRFSMLHSLHSYSGGSSSHCLIADGAVVYSIAHP